MFSKKEANQHKAHSPDPLHTHITLTATHDLHLTFPYLHSHSAPQPDLNSDSPLTPDPFSPASPLLTPDVWPAGEAWGVEGPLRATHDQGVPPHLRGFMKTDMDRRLSWATEARAGNINMWPKGSQRARAYAKGRGGKSREKEKGITRGIEVKKTRGETYTNENRKQWKWVGRMIREEERKKLKENGRTREDKGRRKR